jgi:hypothetical protein
MRISSRLQFPDYYSASWLPLQRSYPHDVPLVSIRCKRLGANRATGFRASASSRSNRPVVTSIAVRAKSSIKGLVA